MTARGTARAPSTLHERLWRAIVRLGDRTFTARDLHGSFSELTLDSLRHALLDLQRRRLLLMVGERSDVAQIKPTKVYRCADRTAPFRPAPKPDAVSTRQQQLWTAMRTLAGWTVAEVAAAASTEEIGVSRVCASAYVSTLLQAGILQVLHERNAAIGMGSTAASYRLLPSANSGPRAPEVHRGRRVYDPNRRSYIGQASEVAA